MANRPWAEMKDIYPARLVELLREAPIVYVPSGILEWHDEHLPMGTDTLKMEEICRRTARITGGLVHMPSYLGVGAITPTYGSLKHGGIGFSLALAKQYLLELCAQLEALGARLIVLSYGHTGPDNINVHEEAAQEYNRLPQAQTGVLAMNDVAPAVKYRYKVADHAAKWETSFMLASFPMLVDHDRLPAEHGDFWGLDPRVHASAAEGERMYTLIAEETAKLVQLAGLAPRESLANQSYTGSRCCWEHCQNMDDLASNYWHGDERWEDPFCWYCEWRSPGLMRSLLERQGKSWVERRLAIWREAARPYSVRCKEALLSIEVDWSAINRE
jgi:creatinine amidohydrolase